MRLARSVTFSSSSPPLSSVLKHRTGAFWERERGDVRVYGAFKKITGFQFQSDVFHQRNESTVDGAPRREMWPLDIQALTVEAHPLFKSPINSTPGVASERSNEHSRPKIRIH